MRKYVIAFMEQRMGVKRLSQMPGAEGEASFEAEDDDAALSHVTQHFQERVKASVRAELSSMAIITDAQSPRGYRVVDDSMENPHFHDIYIKFDPQSRKLEVDFESTRTALLTDYPQPRLSRV